MRTSKAEWEAMMAPVHAQYAKPVLEEGEEPEAAFTVTESNESVDPTTLARSPKGVWKKATDLGLELVLLQSTVTHHETSYILKDGKERRDGTRAQKGDVRTPAHDQTHLFMAAVDRAHHIGFLASWTDGKFQNAHIRDPFGFPTELFVDYEFEHQHAEYNDGTQYLNTRHHTTSAKELSGWLDELAEILGAQMKGAA